MPSAVTQKKTKDNLSEVRNMDFIKECEKLFAEGKSGTNGLLKADNFNIDVRVGNGIHKPRLHICSQDEFTYVLSGEVEMYVEGDGSTLLTTGQGLLIKSGIKHKTLARDGATWLLISAPHKHHYFE